MTDQTKRITKRITKKDLRIATEFAEARFEKSKVHYMRRKQFNEAKVKHDIMVGALGEIASYKMLKEDYGIKVSFPDLNVYEKAKKTFNADLVDKQGRNYHVKSQSITSSERYGRSYILQYGGNGHGHTDKLFRNTSSNDYLIPTEVDTEKMIVTLFGCYRIETIFKEDMIKMPKIKWLQDIKRAIYLDDLETLNYYERWGRLNSFSML